MSEQPVGCSRPVGQVVGEEKAAEKIEKKEEERNMSQARVGRKAPGFEMTAYFDGKYVPVKLSDYVGKWLLLCFYPGDFTFV